MSIEKPMFKGQTYQELINGGMNPWYAAEFTGDKEAEASLRAGEVPEIDECVKMDCPECCGKKTMKVRVVYANNVISESTEIRCSGCFGRGWVVDNGIPWCR